MRKPRNDLKNLEQMVSTALMRFNPNALLRLEKERRGFAAGELVFVGMADIAKYYWCAEKSLLANKNMELGFFSAYLHDRLLYSLELEYIKRIPEEPEDLLTVGENLSRKDFETLLKRRAEMFKPDPAPFLFARNAAFINPKLSPKRRKKLERPIKEMGFKIADLRVCPSR